MKRQSRNLSSGLEHRLDLYALAASAAGVGVLALAQPSEAKIVYTHVHKSITPTHTIPLDLNHDGMTDFRFKDIHYTTSQFGFSHIGILSVVPAQHGNVVEGYSQFNRQYGSALKAGVSIGPKGPFKTGPKLMARVFSDTGAHHDVSSCSGPWSKAVDRYLGVKFLIKGKAHFGWARLNVSCPGSDVVGTLTGYAYETVANKPIIAGKTNGPDVVAVQPIGLGHLALGSRIPAWRAAESAAIH